MTTRFRIKEDTTSSFTFANWGKKSGTYQWNIPSTKNYFTARTSMLDEVVPGFRKLVAKGVIINNMMRREIYKLTIQKAEMYRAGNLNGFRYEQLYEFLPEEPVSTIGPILYSDPLAFDTELIPYESARDFAITRAHANVSLAEIDGGASLGEAKETLKWIGSILRRGTNLASIIASNRSKPKSRRKKLPRRSHDSLKSALEVAKREGTAAAKRTPDAWMEYRYAIRPLLYEMEQARTALRTILYRRRSTSRGFNRVDTATSSDVLIGNQTDFDWHKRTTYSIRSNYRAGVMYDIDNDINEMAAIWGLDSPLGSLWELTRLSYAVDWFFNIGDWIQSWQPKASIRTLASWIVETHIHERAVTASDGVNYYWVVPWDTFHVNLGVMKQERIAQRRFPAPPLPALPVSKVRLDLAKIVDLAIIGKGLVTSLRK